MCKNQKIYKQCHHKCERCHNEENLIIHHIDRDRNHNEFSNFEILCASCHAMEHKRITNIAKMKRFYVTSVYQLTFNI